METSLKHANTGFIIPTQQGNDFKQLTQNHIKHNVYIKLSKENSTKQHEKAQGSQICLKEF